MAQLDDDNTFSPNHLRTLSTTLRRGGTDVAHSWRRLLLPDRTEYVPPGIDPWHPDPAAQARSYQRLEAIGVFTAGSAVVRDRFIHRGELIARVDTSELLVRRELHDRFPFPNEFSRAKQRLQWSEDFVFAIGLGRAGIDVACSQLPTLEYTMGGMSNSDVIEGLT